MTRDDVINLARQAGMGGMLTDVACTLEELERFAALVAAAEREECAKVCDKKAETVNSRWIPLTCADAIRARKDIP